MGYRSDVRITMSKNAYKEFEKDIQEHINNYKINNIADDSVTRIFNYDYNLLNHLDIFKQSKEKDQVYLGWGDVKWYYGYEDVDAIMDSLDKLKEKGYGYYYSRLGESYDDFEEMYADFTDKDEIKYQDAPRFVRYFDDDEFIDLDKNDLDKTKNKNEKER